MTGFGVNVEDLIGHASRLDALAEDLGAAAEAIDAALLGDEAYGKLGAPLASKLNALQDAGRQSVANAMEGIVEAAAGIRDTAAEYADTDEDNAQDLEDSGDGGGD